MMMQEVADPSMKVSDTRDSSFQVFPSTGLGGGSGANTYLQLQTNFPNMNMEEFEQVSANDFFSSFLINLILKCYLTLFSL